MEMTTSSHKDTAQNADDGPPIGEQPETPYLLLTHPEKFVDIVSVRNRTQFLIASTIYAIPQQPRDFSVLGITPPQQKPIHYEVAFLSRHALRVRFRLDPRAKNDEPFPDDPAFPPQHVREWLYRFPIPEEIKDGDDDEASAGQSGQDRLNCGLRIQGHAFNTWVNPYLMGGMEYQYLADEDGNVGLEGFYNYSEESVEASNSGKGVVLSEEDQQKQIKERVPLWKISTRGPFSHASMPSGIGHAVGQASRCFELFELRLGENLHLQFSTKHSPTRPDKQLEKGEERPDAVFLWTDRNWGCLVKNPLPIAADILARLGRNQVMLSVSTEDSAMEYIIVAGEDFQRMKAEYGPKTEEDNSKQEEQG